METLQNNGHHLETLAQDGDNKVVYCHQCEAFHINYETISIDLKKVAVETLINNLRLYYQRYKGAVDPTHRCIHIGTPYMGIRLLLSISDLEDFQKRRS